MVDDASEHLTMLLGPRNVVAPMGEAKILSATRRYAIDLTSIAWELLKILQNMHGMALKNKKKAHDERAVEIIL